MASDKGSLTGPRKAAILLATLGAEAASLILRHLSEREVTIVANELAALEPVSPEVAHKVLEESAARSDAEPTVVAGADYARQLLHRAFDEEGAKQVLRRVPILNKTGPSALDHLKAADPRLLATLLQEEHPQTVALVLAQLDPNQSSAILRRLSQEVAPDVLLRMAKLKQFSPELANTVADVLARKLQNFSERERQSYPGLKGAADLMNRVETTAAAPLLEALEQAEPELAVGIRNLMFTFEDLITIPEVSLREWLAAIDKKTLALALKGSSQEVNAHILKGMSSRAGQMLKEDIEALGPTRGKEIAKAQEELIAVARQLEAEGKLVLRVDGDDEYVV
jgi:flagellar motor switch protein FliG